MALFKSRKAGEEPTATAPQAESVEAMRRRARHRLIGATVLVLLGVIGFPLLFDTQPRPIAVDIPIEIPDRDKVKPLAPPQPAAQAPAVSGIVTAAPQAAPVASQPQAQTQVPQIAQAEPKPEPKPEPKVAAQAADQPDESARAKALLEGKPVKAEAAADGRFVVQVGAFADAAKAQETRRKVERAGLKTYAQVTETRDGKRTRVRVGPFSSRAEAEKAADKIKGLDLPAAILTL